MKTKIHELKFINKIDVSKTIKHINKVRCFSIALVLIATFFTSCSEHGFEANEVSEFVIIPDENFEQALIDLGFDTNGLNGNILHTDAETVTTLDIINKNISSLVGIEGFTNLMYLYSDENNLTTLDISQNNLLVEVGFNDNQLTNIDVSKNTELQFLYCSKNNLTSLDVSNNTLLKTLHCFDNQITDIDLSINTDLRSLSISDNNLTAIDVSQNIMLREVICNNNELTSFNIKNGFNEDIIFFGAINNPNLTCIEVDNPNYSNFQWEHIDSQATFLVNCN